MDYSFEFQTKCLTMAAGPTNVLKVAEHYKI